MTALETSTGREQLLAKALYFTLSWLDEGKGISIKDDVTGDMVCIFLAESEEDDSIIMTCQKSDTLTDDMVVCDIIEKEEK